MAYIMCACFCRQLNEGAPRDESHAHAIEVKDDNENPSPEK